MRPSGTWPCGFLPPSPHCKHARLPAVPATGQDASPSGLCTPCSLGLEFSGHHLATSLPSAKTPFRGHSTEGPSLATLPTQLLSLPTTWPSSTWRYLVNFLDLLFTAPVDWRLPEIRGAPESPGPEPAGCSASSRIQQESYT